MKRNAALRSPILSDRAERNAFNTVSQRITSPKLLLKKSRQFSIHKGSISLYSATIFFLIFVWNKGTTELPPQVEISSWPSFVQVPVVVEYDPKSNGASALPRSTTRTIKESKKDTIRFNNHDSSESDDDNNDDGEDEEDEEYSTCKPMHEWQTQSFPQCMRLHEIGMNPRPDSLVFINCGQSRCAWMVQDLDGQKVTLKTRKYTSTMDQEAVEDASGDGKVMERLTMSPYVATIYGYCGLSQIVEYSEGGNIHDLVKTTRLRGKDIHTPLDRLKIGIQIAKSLADLHTFEKDGITSVVHADLCCHQYILVDGIYKLSDFHIARFLKRDPTTRNVCKEPKGFSSAYALLHAPEESLLSYTDSEKADVFTMGNVMYYVLTKKWLFEIGEESAKAAVLKLLQGERSPIPTEIKNSNDPADQALIEGIRLSWTHNPLERPRATQIADIMISKMEKIQGTKYQGPDSIRVSIPPLPKDYSYSDSEFLSRLKA